MLSWAVTVLSAVLVHGSARPLFAIRDFQSDTILSDKLCEATVCEEFTIAPDNAFIGEIERTVRIPNYEFSPPRITFLNISTPEGDSARLVGSMSQTHRSAVFAISFDARTHPIPVQLCYSISDGLRRRGSELLWQWDMVGSDWEEPVEVSGVRIHVPTLLAAYVKPTSCEVLDSPADASLTVQCPASRVFTGQGYVVEVQYTPHTAGVCAQQQHPHGWWSSPMHIGAVVFAVAIFYMCIICSLCYFLHHSSCCGYPSPFAAPPTAQAEVVYPPAVVVANSPPPVDSPSPPPTPPPTPTPSPPSGRPPRRSYHTFTFSPKAYTGGYYQTHHLP